MIAGISALAMAVPLRARAQQARRRIAIASAFTPEELEQRGGWREGTGNPSFDAFFAALRREGFTEGGNLVVERWAEERLTDVDGFARSVVASAPEVIVANNLPLLAPLARATRTVPLVLSGGDAVHFGLISNPARPGGNITGAASEAGHDIYGLWLQLIREAVPSARSVAYLVRTDRADFDLPRIQEAAAATGVHVMPVVLEAPRLTEADLRNAVQRMAGADALVVAPGVANTYPGGAFVEAFGDLVAAARIPTMTTLSLGNAANIRSGPGVLMNHAQDPEEVVERFARLGLYVGRILRGEKPGDLPYFYPTRFNLIINLKSARILGLTLPLSLISQATEFVE